MKNVYLLRVIIGVALVLVLLPPLRSQNNITKPLHLAGVKKAPAPSPIYFSATGSYRFASAPMQLGTNTSNSLDYSGLYGSYGRGLSGEGTFGYELCDHFSAELSTGYFCGHTYEYSYNTSTSKNTYTNRLSGFYVTPSALVIGNTWHGITPYGRMGVMFGATTHMVSEYDGSYTFGMMTSTTLSTLFVKPAFKPGYEGGIGATFPIIDKLSLRAELTVRSYSFKPKSSEYTRYIINGSDKLDDLTTYQRENVYKDSYTATSTPPQDKPRTSLATPYPASSIGISLGVAYNFPKNPVAKTPEPEPPVGVAPPVEIVDSCKCAGLDIDRYPNGKIRVPVKLEKTKSITDNTKQNFKISVSNNITLTCTGTNANESCTGNVYIACSIGANGETGYHKVVSADCGTTQTYAATSVFLSPNFKPADADKQNWTVKITIIAECNGKYKKLTSTMDLMSGSLVNQSNENWSNMTKEEGQKVTEEYNKSSTEYLRPAR